MKLRWPITVLLVLVALTNVALVWSAYVVNPTKVTDKPWLDSRNTDGERAAQAAFTAAGGSFTAAVTGRSVALSGQPVGATDLLVECYRPSDASLDQRSPWDGQPTTRDLSRPGRWVLRIHGTMGQVRGVLWERDLEAW